MPFLASLMDVPFKRDLVEALRAASAQESPEQIEQRIKQAVQDALKQAGNELKARELDIKERLSEAQIKELMAKAVQTGISGAFAAMQAGEKIALNPAVAPIGDIVMKQAGWQPPNPEGADPNIPTPAQATPVVDPGGEPGDTSPMTPQAPYSANVGANEGMETLRTD